MPEVKDFSYRIKTDQASRINNPESYKYISGSYIEAIVLKIFQDKLKSIHLLKEFPPTGSESKKVDIIVEIGQPIGDDTGMEKNGIHDPFELKLEIPVRIYDPSGKIIEIFNPNSVVLIQFDGNLSGRQIEAKNIKAGQLLCRDVIAKLVKHLSTDQ
jgi:hypothetical protein